MNSPVRYQTGASLNNRAGAPILPLHCASAQQTWTAPAPPYSPPSSPPPRTSFPSPAVQLNSSATPSFPVPVHAHNDPTPQMYFSMPSMPPRSPAPPAPVPQHSPELVRLSSPPNTPSNLVDRMREVQTLMLEIHQLESEPGSNNNNEKIQELQRRVAQLSRTDASLNNNASGTTVPDPNANAPPPYFPPPPGPPPGK